MSNDFNINVINRNIYFSGEINLKSMNILIKELLRLENKILKKHINIKSIINKQDVSELFSLAIKPINLYITSFGGGVRCCFACIDIIKNMKVHVHTYVLGVAASSATLLSLAGHRRFITQNSYMLIHELSTGINWSKFTEIRNELENIVQLHTHIKKYYVDNTNLSEEEVESQLEKDLYFTPEESLENGFVDEIV